LEIRHQALSSARAAATLPARGWLRAVREAVGLKQSDVAARIAVRRQSLAQFERSEEKGSIILGSLRRAAGAMDCELVYFVIPRWEAGSFANLARRHNPAQKHLQATEQSMMLSEPGPRDGGR